MNARTFWQSFKRRVLGACLLGLSAWTAAAENECPPEPKPLSPEMLSAAQRQARDRGFLWRVSKDGHSSYLYGTLHVGREAWLSRWACIGAGAEKHQHIGPGVGPAGP